MSKKFVQLGEVVDHVAASAITADDVVVMGDTVGIALADIASGETGPVQITGVFTMAKATGAIAQGDKVDYDVSAGNVAKGITPAAGDVTDFGIAAAAAESGDATLPVLLTPGNGSIN